MKISRMTTALLVTAAGIVVVAGCATAPLTSITVQGQTTATTSAQSPSTTTPVTTTASSRGPQIVIETPDPAPTGAADLSKYGPITRVPQEYWANFASDDKAQYGGREIRWMVAVDLLPSAGEGSNWLVVAEIAALPTRMQEGSFIRVSYPAWLAGDMTGTVTPTGKPGEAEPMNRSAFVYQRGAPHPDYRDHFDLEQEAAFAANISSIVEQAAS